MKNIVYLLKIQKEADHQEKLINQGMLYMNCAKYYRCLYKENEQQGDLLENALWMSSGGVSMLAPMFCLYTIFEEDIKQNKILIPIDLVKDFCKDKAYITILKYPEFKNVVCQYAETRNVSVHSGLITYGKPSKNFIKENYAIDKLYKFMFIKSKKYEKQKEYRIVFDDICQAEFEEENIDGIKVPVFKNVKPKDDYCIGNIKDISKSFEFDVSNQCNDIEIKL